jgi:anti-anti-sigma regulatory factor
MAGYADIQPDRCPYRRPFEADFVECAAFQLTSFIAADSRNKPLGSWHTCRHLTSGNDSQNRGRFYPRCALGSLEQRIQWLARVSPARLDVVRALQQEFDAFSLPHRERLFEARKTFQANPRTRAIEQQTRQVIDDFLGEMDGFLTRNQERFQDVGLPTDPLRQLIAEWVWAWVRTPELATAPFSDPPPDTFSDPARTFLGLPVAPTEAPAGRMWDRPLYSDSILQILPTVNPTGLALVGDVDASNVEAVARALGDLPQGPADVHLDLSGLLFCDLAGLQAIVRAAQALGGGRRLVIRGIPSQLERALKIVDWAPLPSLRIASEDRE